MLFIDGVGIGEDNPAKNPFFRKDYRFLTGLFNATPHLGRQTLEGNKAFLFPADARMGVEGLPQSGTGQASIFCGINAPQINNKHFGPFPPSSVVPYIELQNIFRSVREAGMLSYFANAYPQVFFRYISSGKARLSVTTLSQKLNSVPLHRAGDVRSGKALTAEITGERWNEKLHYSLPLLTPERAAKRLLRIAINHSLTVYEYFLTDHLGHGRIADEFERITETLDRFLYMAFSGCPEELTILLCSDHGNFEDTSVKAHTENPALTISYGRYARLLRENIADLSHIKAAITKVLEQ